MKNFALIILGLFIMQSITGCNVNNDSTTLANVLEERERINEGNESQHTTRFITGANNIEQDTTTYVHWLKMLNEIDVKSLTNDDAINYDVLKLVIEDNYFRLKNKMYLMPLNSEGGFITGMLYNTQSKNLKSAEDQENYLTKLKSIPAYFDAQIELLNQGLETGTTVPRNVVEKCLVHVNTHVNANLEELFLMQPIMATDNETYIQTCTAELKESTLPAFKKLQAYLRDTYVPATRSSIGISEATNGKTIYEQRVKYFTTLDISPQEVFDKGQSEVKRIREEMQVIIDSLGFKGSYAEFLSFLRTDKQFYPKTPEQLLHNAAWLSKKADESLPSLFGHLPSLPYTVNPVPASIAENYTTGRYVPGSYENNTPGQYWVNTYDLKSRPLYVLAALTLHEAVPGHHLQGAIAQEIEDVPSIRKTYISAFGEGWGLYSEYLGKEAGIYETLYDQFGALTYEMWRACRLVVDPGMHYYGWSREEAVEFMKSNTALSDLEINSEVDRYIGWPGQAVSYKIGELKIKELRQKTEEELGELFSIRDFHDVILKNGSVPLKTLERVVEEHINSAKETSEN